MSATFFVWQESLGWQAALCFLGALAVTLCVVALLIDAYVRRFLAWREIVAIKEKNWQQRKERSARVFEAQRLREMQRADDKEFLRRLEIDIANDESQRMRERQQFHVSPAFRDFKGVQK